jgi:hypothetical protein
MPENSDSGTTGGSEFGFGTSRSEAAMHETSVMPGGPAGQGAVAADGLSPAQHGPHPSYHGRTVSWVAVGIMVLGFLLGGVALVAGGHGGPIWWLFWTGAGVAVLGLLISLATNMFEDWY